MTDVHRRGLCIPCAEIEDGLDGYLRRGGDSARRFVLQRLDVTVPTIADEREEQRLPSGVVDDKAPVEGPRMHDAPRPKPRKKKTSPA
jgi:hypothetical protein